MVKLVFVLLKVRMTNSGREASRKNVYYTGAMGRCHPSITKAKTY